MINVVLLFIPCGLPGVHRVFSGFTPVVAADFSTLLYDAVARYQEGDRVRTDLAAL